MGVTEAKPQVSAEAAAALVQAGKDAVAANLKADTKEDPQRVAQAVEYVNELRAREKIGVIRCDYEYATTRGDPGEPTSFLSDSAILKVEGWTFEAVQRGMTPEGGYPASEFRLKKADGSVDEYWTKLWNCYPDKDGSSSNRKNYIRVTKKVTGNKYIEGYFDEDDYVKGEVYRYEPEQMEENMKTAIQKLEQAGVCGISCDVGYSHAFHDSVKQMTSVPVMLSSLQQLTLIAPLFDLRPEKNNKVLVVTVNSDTFDANQLVPKGLPEGAIHIIGMQKTIFGKWVAGGHSFSRFHEDAFEDASVEKGLESLYDECKQEIDKIQSTGANVVCIVLECAEMPAYTNGLRRRFKLPVYDTMTAISFLQAGAGFGASSGYMM
eukprot:CAMPEP_0172471820 /NCGR_PEP_ID=MMETSP1065-20121228/68017_1 /TAXON_ID=265537 /ORGANISM="Amphiprora paludosa, Strain CCMP125" /LENGTH=377 /DNA_ID=CAMNT_0013229935 /DNA_START=130 /DNA_END=1263 /DNA_ORIENTATION=-